MNNTRMSEPVLPNRTDMQVPLLRHLIQMGGSVHFGTRGRQIELVLAKHFNLSDEERDFAAPNYHSEGNRKWRNHIQFVRAQLVDLGQISNARHGYWTVTPAGYKRVGLPVPNTNNSTVVDGF